MGGNLKSISLDNSVLLELMKLSELTVLNVCTPACYIENAKIGPEGAELISQLRRLRELNIRNPFLTQVRTRLATKVLDTSAPSQSSKS